MVISLIFNAEQMREYQPQQNYGFGYPTTPYGIGPTGGYGLPYGGTSGGYGIPYGTWQGYTGGQFGGQYGAYPYMTGGYGTSQASYGTPYGYGSYGSPYSTYPGLFPQGGFQQAPYYGSATTPYGSQYGSYSGLPIGQQGTVSAPLGTTTTE
jgi:hypothetical protein